MKITQERLKELFDYREDGELIWRVSPCNAISAGDVAGWCNRQGYLLIGVAQRDYLSHRLIWCWNHGYFPEHGIDHIDRNPKNNRIENLREVSQTCNMRNNRQRKSTSGVKRVCWQTSSGKWYAQLNIGEKTYNLGRFSDFTEAVAHRLAAEQCLNWEGCDSCSPAYQFMKRYQNV